MWEPRERGQRAVNRDLPPGAEISDLASQLSLCNASSPQSLPAGDQARQPKAAPAEHRFLEEETEQQQQQPLASPLLPMPTASLRWETEAKAEASEKARGRGGPGPRGGRGRASPPPPGRAGPPALSLQHHPRPAPRTGPGPKAKPGAGGGAQNQARGGLRATSRHSPLAPPPAPFAPRSALHEPLGSNTPSCSSWLVHGSGILFGLVFCFLGFF